MRLLRRGDNPNAVAGVFLLILLLAITGPNILPRLASNIPNVDEGVPCSWLREGEDRAIHQSLIGRDAGLSALPPISLSVVTNALPSDPTSTLTVSITVVNNTIGTVPFLLPNDVVAVGIDNNQPGLGVIFNGNSVVPPLGANNVTYPEEQIRLLSPRQRCVHRVSFQVSELTGILGGFGNDTIIAYYRNGSRGAAQATVDGQIYIDQGLWIGVVQSDSFTIPVSP